MYKESLSIRESSLGLSHPDVAQTLNELAYLYTSQARFGEAKEYYERSAKIIEESYGQNHPEYAGVMVRTV